MVERRVVSPRPPMKPVLLTFKEAMEFLRVSRSTLYRLMWSGQLRGHKVGSTWRFYESDLLAAVANPLDERETQSVDGDYGEPDEDLQGLNAHGAPNEKIYRLEGQES